MKETESFKEKLGYWTYASMAWLSENLPERAGRLVFRIGGRLAFALVKSARATVSANLAQVMGLPSDSELLRASVREAFDRYAEYWYETFRLRVMSRAELYSRMSAEGLEHMAAAIDAGKGAIAVAAHMGNWDAAGAYVAAEGFDVVAVAEALRPKRLLDLFVRHREEIGMKIISLEKGGKVAQQLSERLAGNCVVALVADRDLSGKGIEVEMFGAKRNLPAGPAVLSTSTGAPILVVSVYSEGERWRMHISPPLEISPSGNVREDVVALTRVMAGEFEKAIAASPTNWHMFQPAWP